MTVQNYQSLMEHTEDLENLGIAVEDTVQCRFYSSIHLDINNLEELHIKLNKLIAILSQEYMWHKDEFEVFVPVLEKSVKSIPQYLVSNTCFGDNIEDEWFIVYLVLEITKHCKDLVVQIIDNDGDFLMIEAADYLPSWAKPDNMKNRVFLHNNHIHMIPPDIVALNMELSIENAIQHILQFPQETQVSYEIDEAIRNRIGNYHEKIQDMYHRSIVRLPLDIATLLKLQPSMIAPIVDKYCDHDMIDAKLCKKVEFDDCVQTEIKFTKCLYAMLKHSKAKKHSAAINNDKSTELGLKITFGYHMILNDTTNFSSSREYKRFMVSLKENGYFKNNLEGSTDYKILLDNAIKFFKNIYGSTTTKVSETIKTLISSEDFSKVKASLRDQSPTLCDLIEDTEDWLQIDPDKLNTLLNNRYGKITSLKNKDVITSEALTKELSDFLKNTSDYEGIETNRNENDVNETSDNEINFDCNQFKNCLEDILANLSDDNDDISTDYDEDSCDDLEFDSSENENIELTTALHDLKQSDPKNSLLNLVQSMKEEKASSGPSSNLLHSIGINKMDLLDSDDD